MLLIKDYYRVAFENRLRTNQLGDVDDYNLKLAKLKNNSYPLPYSFKGDYTEHLAHENLFRRFGTVIHTEIEEELWYVWMLCRNLKSLMRTSLIPLRMKCVIHVSAAVHTNWQC